MKTASFETDESLADELYIYITNDSNLYRQMILPIWKNLSRKMQKGIYKRDLAIKGMESLTEAGAKGYAKEFGAQDDLNNWYEMFPRNIRKITADDLVTKFESEYESKEYDFMQDGTNKTSAEVDTESPEYDFAAAYKINFLEPFELDKDSNFITEKDFEDEVTVVSQDEDYITYRLNQNTANELKRTFNIFMSEVEAQARLDNVAEFIEKDVKTLIKHEVGEEASKLFKVSVDYGEGIADSHYFTISINGAGEDFETFEPRSLYYQQDTGSVINSAMESWDWALWLMHEDSPFASDYFTNVYLLDDASNVLESLADFEDVSGDIRKFVQESYAESKEAQELDTTEE